jgi:hypothetical protein
MQIYFQYKPDPKSHYAVHRPVPKMALLRTPAVLTHAHPYAVNITDTLVNTMPYQCSVLALIGFAATKFHTAMATNLVPLSKHACI